MEVSQRAEGCRDQWAGPWKTNQGEEPKGFSWQQQEKRNQQRVRHTDVGMASVTADTWKS